MTLVWARFTFSSTAFYRQAARICFFRGNTPCTLHISQTKCCWVPLKLQYSFFPQRTSNYCPCSPAGSSWLLPALQQHTLEINRQMQLRLRQAVLFLPKKSFHLHRTTLMMANSNEVEVASRICCWFCTLETYFFHFNFRNVTQLPRKALRTNPIHSSRINLHTPNKASWSCSFNAVLALSN